MNSLINFRRWLAANSTLAVNWLFRLRNLIDLTDANVFSCYVSLIQPY